MDDNTPEIDISDYLVSLYMPRLFMAQEYKNTDEYCDFRENLRCVFYDDFVDKYLNLEIIKDFDILKKWVTENAKCRDGLTILRKMRHLYFSDSE